MDWAYTMTGFVVGALVGLTGVGGGALLTPALIFVFGLSPIVAVGTDLAFAAITKTVGGITHARQKTVDWAITQLLFIGSIPGAILMLVFISQFDMSDEQVGAIIRSIVGCALLLTAFVLFYGSIKKTKDNDDLTAKNVTSTKPVATILSGFFLGCIVTVSSIGAGACGVAILRWLYPHMRLSRVVGTDIVHAVGLATVASLGHWQLNTINSSVLLALLIGSLPGIYLGSRCVVYLPEILIQRILAALLMLVGVKLVV